MTVPTQSAAPMSRTEKQALLRRILVERISRVRTEPASFAQERLWFLDRMGDAGATYNMPAALRLSGPLDVAALERALGEEVRRHESLRTSFAESDGAAMQVITPFSGFTLPVEDLVSVDADDRDAEVRRRAADDAARPFDLATGPLFRASLLRLGAEEHVLLLCTHHVVSDAWSMGVFFRELSALYAAFTAGTEASLPALPMQYADFATWQREYLKGQVLDEQLAYWRQRLDPGALLELPVQYADYAVWQREQLRGEALERELAYWRERLAGLFPALGGDHRRS
ncbi:MAG TPA: condensation domain-containing protein, partial [Longimicrobium sp.]|nr:condensation domain-containing protein [Longimicrobium sp.]